MMQEIGAQSRILGIQLRRKVRGIRNLSKKKRRVRPFRVAAALLGLCTLYMAMQFPGKAVSLERQQAQLEAAASAYYDVQSENNQLKTALLEINTPDFIERTARREYGYCWYGETIYEVANLDAITPEQAFDVYGQD